MDSTSHILVEDGDALLLQGFTHVPFQFAGDVSDVAIGTTVKRIGEDADAVAVEA